jgi:thiol-disulfide isomerase/thioredoxin
MNLFDNLIDLTNVENNPFNSFNQRDETTSKPSLENQLQVLKEFDALTKEFNSNLESKNSMYKTIKKMRTLHGKTIKSFYTQLLTQNNMSQDDFLVLSTVDTTFNNMRNVIKQAENIIKDTKPDPKPIVKDDKDTKKSSNKSNPINNDFKDINPDLPSIVLFYKDWCGHCKQFKPVWNEFTKITDKKYINVLMTDDDKIIKNNNVDGFPTVKFFKDGESDVYSGERTVSGLSDFVNGILNVQAAKPLASN